MQNASPGAGSMAAQACGFLAAAWGDQGLTDYEPGQRVRHPQRPNWGLGQVQSITGTRVTVNFENAGKVLVNAALVALDIVDE